MSSELPKQYDPSTIERAIYQRWTDSGVFTANVGSEREPYVIVIPPPNVTGTLHMGHAFQDTIMDALTRYKDVRRGRRATFGLSTGGAALGLAAGSGTTLRWRPSCAAPLKRTAAVGTAPQGAGGAPSRSSHLQP